MGIAQRMGSGGRRVHGHFGNRLPMSNFMWRGIVDAVLCRFPMLRSLSALPIVQATFGAKRSEIEERKVADTSDDLGIPMKPSRPVEQATSPTRRPVTPPRTVAVARRSGDPAAGETPRRTGADIRQLIVGPEISLSGDISSCDKLIVEGSVEANLTNCHDVNITESGLFKGSASIDEAEIRGRFEGNLTVRKRLLIRASGHVSGMIRYGQIEIECGGQISGDVQAQPTVASEAKSDSAGIRAAE